MGDNETGWIRMQGLSEEFDTALCRCWSHLSILYIGYSPCCGYSCCSVLSLKVSGP